MSLTTVDKELTTSQLIIVDCETYTLEARHNPELPVYFVGVLEVGQSNRILRFTDVEQAIDHIEARASTGWQIVAHNAKFDKAVLEIRGLPKFTWACTQIMAYARDSGLQSFSLSALTGLKTDIIAQCQEAGYIGKLKPAEFWQTDWRGNEGVLSLMADYCVQDLKATHSLYKKLAAWYNQPDNHKHRAFLWTLEFPFLDVLVQLETAGMPVDERKLSDLSHSLTIEVNMHKELLATTVGKLPMLKWNGESYEPFVKVYKNGVHKNAKANKSHYIDSAGSLCASDCSLVYDHCPIVPFNSAAATGHLWWLIHNHAPEALESAGKTKKGKPQLNGDYILDIGSQLPDNLPFTKLLKATKSLQMVTTLANHTGGGRVHGDFNHTFTRTGRLSSSNPNLQNAPRAGSPESVGTRFRQVFTARPGYKYLVADLDRIEIVVLAHFLAIVTKDENLRTVVNTGADVHQHNADLWKVSRDVAKTLIFLMVYGGQAGLMFKRGLAPSLEAAQALLEQVDKSQPSIQKLKMLVWKRVRDRGFVTNRFGAHIPYPELTSNVKWIKAAGERKSFNAIIQATARSVFHALCIESLPCLQELGGQFICLVHDEAHVEVPEANADALVSKLNQVWQERYDLLPGTRVNGDWNSADNWYAAK
jgi:DNA polymerase I-like protein with 3'-5' exonuclease and polymerase domains